MHVLIHLHAELETYATASQGVVELDLPLGSTVRDLCHRFGFRQGHVLIVGINGQVATKDSVLSNNDQVDLVTPMAGGGLRTTGIPEEVQMPNGYWDHILHVDLADGKTWTESLGEGFFRRFMGGRSLIAHYLLREVPTGADPLGPDNVLVFAAGVLTGVPVPGAGRHSVGAKSPLTGGFGEAECGGFWGAELRHAGWDGIVVHGCARRPVYLWIKNDKVELRDASHLWGHETQEVEESIRSEFGDSLIRVAQVGIAGENAVRYALIVSDLNEMAGRTGLGAVMASKHLKAIAVRGTNKVPVADSTPLRETAKWVTATMDENHYNFHHYGTGAAMMGKQIEGHLITRNFQDGQWSQEQVAAIDAKAIAAKYLESMDGCFGCSVRCKKRVRHDALGVDPSFGGPEYETIGAIGTNLLMDDLPVLMLANQRLNQLGMDSVSFGGTLAWAIECFERGLLTDDDTGGIALRWGDGATLLRVVDLVGRREGPLGDLLAEGSRAAARRVDRGSERYAVQIKGLEVAMHDPRGMQGMLENYPVNPTGGDHTGAAMQKTALCNVVGLCQFLAYDQPRVVDLINGVTGWTVDEEELRKVACRGLSLARLFNLREGLTAADDRLPSRFHEPMAKGPLSDKQLTEEDVKAVVARYYEQQGWDTVTGVPLEDTLMALDILEYAEYAPGLVASATGKERLLPAVMEGI